MPRGRKTKATYRSETGGRRLCPENLLECLHRRDLARDGSFSRTANRTAAATHPGKGTRCVSPRALAVHARTATHAPQQGEGISKPTTNLR